MKSVINNNTSKKDNFLKPRRESYKVVFVKNVKKTLFLTSTYNLVANDIVVNGGYISKYNKFGQTPFMVACSEGNIELVINFIRKYKYSVSINDVDKDDWTPLMISTQKGHTEIVQILVFNRAELDNVDVYGNSALMIAAYLGNLEIVKILVKARANIKLSDENGDTALIMAAKKGYYQIVQFIEKYY
jgi:ankyrin repeat protein